MIKAVLFDLDGTLLPMDQDRFISEYMKGLTLKMTEYGYEPHEFAAALQAGIKAVYKNDGSVTNEDRFWQGMSSVLSRDARKDEEYFNLFYKNEFQDYKRLCGYDERAKKTLAKIKAMGYRTALATNPFFPRVATESRMNWAGLSYDDFELVTTFDNSKSCKPNPNYYTEVANKMGLLPKECLMVGNDVRDDMVAKNVGMKVFLLCDGLINIKNEDISVYPRGSFEELIEYIESLAAQ